MRKPFDDVKARFAGHAIAPRRRYLSDTVSSDVGLSDHLQTDLKPGFGIYFRCGYERAAIHLEIVGRVVGGNTGQIMKREAGRPRHQILKRRPSNLLSASHIPGSTDNVESVVDDQPIHGVDVV